MLIALPEMPRMDKVCCRDNGLLAMHILENILPHLSFTMRDQVILKIISTLNSYKSFTFGFKKDARNVQNLYLTDRNTWLVLLLQMYSVLCTALLLPELTDSAIFEAIGLLLSFGNNYAGDNHPVILYPRHLFAIVDPEAIVLRYILNS